MGLDLLDVKFRIERAFHIHVPQGDLVQLERGGDIVVGDVYELILQKLQLCDLGRYDLRLNRYLWCGIREAIHGVTGSPLEQIELGTDLENLFPRETRRAQWQALRDVSPYRIRELDYSELVRLCGFLIAAGVVAVEHWQIWQIPGLRWFWPLLGVFGLWMVFETYLKLLSILAPLRNCFPKTMKTVKDLCRSVLSSNYAQICNDSQIALDRRCSAAWEQLVTIFVDALGVDPGEVTFRSRLFRDLGAA